MSTTAYLHADTGAAPITGTTPTTIFAAPPPDIDDTDIADEWAINHMSMVLQHTGDQVDFDFDLIANGTPIHRNTFEFIGSDTQPRAFKALYEITPISTTHALVFCTASLSGSGEVGPNARQRSTASTPVTQPFPITGPITLDLRVSLSLDSVEYVFTPIRTRIHKVEPVLSAGAGGGGDVLSVNGKTGTVILVPSDIGAAAANAIGAPVIEILTSGPNAGKYAARPDTITAPVVNYAGPIEPTAATCVAPAFRPDHDFWDKTTS